MPKEIPFDNTFVVKVIEDMTKTAIEQSHKIAVQTHARLVTATPVDTGFARAGWNFTLNEVSTEAPEKKKRPKGSTGPIYEAPKSEPNAKIKVLGDFYSVSNFVEHVVYLNEGHSTQAPAKFIETELYAAVDDVERSEK